VIALSIVGLRFDHLPPSKQALFAFEDGRLSEACVKIKKQTQSKSVLLLATCDRIELWCEQPRTGTVEPLLRSLSLSPLTWTSQTYSISSQESLLHCMSLACGLLSPLFGEDQIISQVQQAYTRSVGVGCASSLLSYLVREVITTAKQVQSKVDLQIVDESVAERVYSLVSAYEKQPVLVIGSSALARSVASFLARRDFIVYMTIRDTEKADLLVPPKVESVAYEKRLSYLSRCHVVISATKGMEYTLTKEQVEGTHLYIDLAPVRDIDPDIEGVVRIEDLDIDLPGRGRETQKALGIIETACAKTEHYLHFRSAVPELQSLAVDAANDLVYRLQAPLKQALAENTDLAQVIHETARKAFSHYLYAQKKEQAKRMHLDLSMPLENGQAGYSGDPAVVIAPFHTLEREGWRLTKLQFGSHAATHMDSPAHLLPEGAALDEIPVSRFFATACVLDCSEDCDITVEKVSCIDSDCDAVLLYTKGKSYLTQEAAAYLVERGVRMFGFDTGNCDRDGDLDFPIHHTILGSNALILENLVNLEHILHRTVQLTALPLSYKHADGSPARVVATYEA
jgi:glutamyl-tRNA reductase